MLSRIGYIRGIARARVVTIKEEKHLAKKKRHSNTLETFFL